MINPPSGYQFSQHQHAVEHKVSPSEEINGEDDKSSYIKDNSVRSKIHTPSSATVRRSAIIKKHT